MGELLVIFLLYGGGLAFAFVFLAIATVRRKHRAAVVTFVILSAFSLFAQVGCWSVASGVGRATNGGDSGESAWRNTLSGGAYILAAWALLLFFSRKPRPQVSEPPPPPPKDNVADD